MTNAIKTIMSITNNDDDDKKISEDVYIQSIVLSIISIQKSEGSGNDNNDISYNSFKQYTEYFNDENVIECFSNTINDFKLLYNADKTGNFKSIQMDNFEDTLFKVDIYGKLLRSNFEQLLWKYIISDKFISYLPGLLSLAFKFENEYNNNCGIKTLQSEMFNNLNRMSSIIGGNKSSFYSLTESQLLYIIQLDCLAINEEKLFNAIKIWCEKDIKSSKKSSKSKKSSYKTYEQRIQSFIPYIRFPLMSINFLLNTILPIKNKIFKNNDDFLYIMIYKINLTLNISKKGYQFDLNNLCCSYQARIYQSDEKGEDESLSLDARLMKLSSENKLLKQKNDELKEKNHKLKAKIQKEKEKRKNRSNDDGNSLTPGTPKKKNTRSATNMFTTG